MSDTEHLELPRAPLTGSVRYWEWNQPRVAAGVEISGNGVFLKTTHAVSEGAHVTVRLELPAVPGMTVLGRVVRTVRGGVLSSPGIGIRFLDLTPEQRERIMRFVEQRIAQSGGVGNPPFSFGREPG
jgi:type IV pilus assembly protein PilZ